MTSLCCVTEISTDVGDLSGQPRTVPVQSSCASNVIFPHIPVWAANHETNWAISFEHDRQFFPLASLKINKIKNFSVFPPPSISFWYYCRRRCWELRSCKGGVKHLVIDPPLHPLCFLRQLGSLFPPQCFEFPPATRKKKNNPSSCFEWAMADVLPLWRFIGIQSIRSCVISLQPLHCVLSIYFRIDK